MDAIVTGIASGMVVEQQNEDIKLTALKALQDARQLLEEKFSDQNVREFVLGLIVGCSTHKNEEIALKAVQCLIDFVKSFYQYLSTRHMDVFSQNIVSLMKKNNLSLIIAGTEFWNSLAYYEQKLYHRQKFNSNVVFSNFINVYASGITQVLLENLISKGNEDTDSGLSLHQATFECLKNVNFLGSKNNQEVNFEFIQSTNCCKNQASSARRKTTIRLPLCSASKR